MRWTFPSMAVNQKIPWEEYTPFRYDFRLRFRLLNYRWTSISPETHSWFMPLCSCPTVCFPFLCIKHKHIVRCSMRIHPFSWEPNKAKLSIQEYRKITESNFIIPLGRYGGVVDLRERWGYLSSILNFSNDNSVDSSPITGLQLCLHSSTPTRLLVSLSRNCCFKSVVNH